MCHSGGAVRSFSGKLAVPIQQRFCPSTQHLALSGYIVGCRHWGSYRHLGGRSQGCCPTSSREQGRPPQQKALWPRMSAVLRLRNHGSKEHLEQSYSRERTMQWQHCATPTSVYFQNCFIGPEERPGLLSNDSSFSPS